MRVQLAGANYLVLGEVQVWSQAAKVNWLVTDQLGRPRMVIDKTGSLAGVSRHDYLPFGAEIFAGTGGRTTTQGYDVADGVRQKFTQKERDNETGLDYFLARYYSPTQGRFTSVDPMPIAKRHILDPRDLNRYAYVANNPLKYIDEEGLEKIILKVRTFIPAEKVQHPPKVGATFRGDYNAKGERVSARTEQVMTFETEAKQPNSSNLEYSKTVGTTVRLARGLGSLTGPSEGHAPGESLTAGIGRINDNSVRVNVRGNEFDPLITGATGNPGITFNFTVSVSSDGATGPATVSVSGEHDGFPAYEIEVIRPDSGGTSTIVYKHDPNVTGDGPQSLYGSGEYHPNDVRTVIEPKKKDKH